MFDTDRASFFPCILHIMMICGKLILSFTRKIALDLPKDRVRLLEATFKAANIRWRGLHRESAPDGQDTQRLLCAWHTVANVLSIHRSAADEAVRQLGEVLLVHDMKTIISECRNFGVGVVMFSNDLTETMNAIMKRIYLQHSSRGGVSATEYGLGEAFALRQSILHVFLLNHAHLKAHGVPRPCTSRLASLDRSIQKPKWTKIPKNFWSSRRGKRYAVKIMMMLTIIIITIIFSKRIFEIFSSGKFISKFHLKKKIFIVRRKIRRAQPDKKCNVCRQCHFCHLRSRNKLQQPQ